MASKDIKGITIAIDGETTALGKALTDVNKKAFAIQKELGEVEKALKFDPKNTELLAQKQQLLGEAVSNTSEKLQKLEAVQADVNQQFKDGKISPEQYRAFNREVEKTKTQLGGLKDKTSSVSAIGQAFGKVKSQVADVTAKLEPLISGLKKAGEVAGKISVAGIKTVGASVNVAKKGLELYGGAALATGTALGAMSVKAAGAADDITTLSTQTGLSREDIQKFQYATDLIDVPLETLTGSMTKLTRNMATAQKGTGKQADAFKSLGVSVTDSNGKLRSNQDVFNETIKALGKVENATERDAMAMDLFGKSAQELNPLIMGGADALKKIGDEAEANGMIMSGDALDNLNNFQDSLDTLKANASGAGNVLGGVFAGGLGDAASLVASSIPKMTGSIANLFSGKNMAGSQAKLTDDLVTMFTGLVDGLAKELPKFLAGFNAVIIAILTAITEVLPSMISDLLVPLIDGLVALVKAIIPMIPTLLPIIVDGAIQLFMGLLDGLNQVIPPLMAMLPGLIAKLSAVLIQNLPLIITAGIQLLMSLIVGITGAIPQLVTSVIALIPVVVGALLANLPQLISAGIQLIIALATGLPKAIPSLLAAIPQIISAIINGIMKTNWLSVGGDIIKGIAKGLFSGIGNINFKGIGSGILGGIKKVFGIHSPSTLFRDQVGANLALGVGAGFETTMGAVTKTMQKAIPSSFDTSVAVNGAASALDQKMASAQNSTYSIGGELNINITGEGAGALNRDPRFLEQVKASIINQLNTEQRAIPNRAGLIPIG